MEHRVSALSGAREKVREGRSQSFKGWGWRKGHRLRRRLRFSAFS